MTSTKATERDESKNGFEEITGEMKDRLKSILSRSEAQTTTENLAAAPDELDEICNLAVSESKIRVQMQELGLMSQHEPARFTALTSALLDRNFDKVLPIQEESFSYRRYVQECNRLKKLMGRLIGIVNDNKKGPREVAEAKQELIAHMARLLVLQSHASDWLEEEYFPGFYERVTNSAKGEVMQYLIKQKNSQRLDAFKDVDAANIHFLDEVEYLRSGISRDTESAGCIVGQDIYLRIPSHYSDTEEWNVFYTLVHELVHHVSSHFLSDFNKLNESITDLVAYVIMREHLDKKKTHLKGQRPKDLMALGYAEYVIIVKQVLSKIPMEYFVDAMLNRDGMERLEAKFEEVFHDPEALLDYAENLDDAYISARERKGKEKGKIEHKAVDQVKKLEHGLVIDLNRRRSLDNKK